MTPDQLRAIPISQIIDNTADQVIPDSFPIWNGGTTKEVKSAIVRHYWMREIGLETVAYWQYAIGTRLQEVMPWFVQAHNNLMDMGNIFDNQNSVVTDSLEHGEKVTVTSTDMMEHDEKITKSGTDTTTVQSSTNQTGTISNTGTDNTDTESQRSDTPQNGLTDVKQGRYLSEAGVGNEVTTRDNTETRNLADSSNGSNSYQYGSSDTHSGTDTRDFDSTNTHSGTDTRTVNRSGFGGDKVQTMKAFMDAHMNIMRDIILSVGDCFMGVMG